VAIVGSFNDATDLYLDPALPEGLFMFGGAKKFQSDPYWRDHLLLYEYFHADRGAGGASHHGMDRACGAPDRNMR
jgi:hypothetical protein